MIGLPIAKHPTHQRSILVAINDGQDIPALSNPGPFNLTPQQATDLLSQMKAEFDKQPQANAIPEPPAAKPVNAVEDQER